MSRFHVQFFKFNCIGNTFINQEGMSRLTCPTYVDWNFGSYFKKEKGYRNLITLVGNDNPHIHDEV